MQSNISLLIPTNHLVAYLMDIQTYPSKLELRLLVARLLIVLHCFGYLSFQIIDSRFGVRVG